MGHDNTGHMDLEIRHRYGRSNASADALLRNRDVEADVASVMHLVATEEVVTDEDVTDVPGPNSLVATTCRRW